MSHTYAPNQTNPLIAVLADHFANRTPEQRRQGLIDAGILTKKGNVAAPYKSVILHRGRGEKRLSIPAHQ